MEVTMSSLARRARRRLAALANPATYNRNEGMPAIRSAAPPGGPEDIPGFMHPEDLRVIARLAATVPASGVIVEVGSWLGQSTFAWASNTRATVFAIDLWEWMPARYDGPAADRVNLHGDAHAQFRANTASP